MPPLTPPRPSERGHWAERSLIGQLCPQSGPVWQIGADARNVG